MPVFVHDGFYPLPAKKKKEIVIKKKSMKAKQKIYPWFKMQSCISNPVCPVWTTGKWINGHHDPFILLCYVSDQAGGLFVVVVDMYVIV